MRKHVIITGTGRAGTTFLVALFTHLGLDTGFDPTDLKLHPLSRAGLERGIWEENAPYIVKSPVVCDMPEHLFGPAIEHVIIPFRGFEEAAESRIHVHELATGRREGGVTYPGGLWDTERAADQANVLRLKFARLLEMLVRYEIPMTFLLYPRLARDPDYLYAKLGFLLSGIDPDHFRATFGKVVKPEWINVFGDADR